MIFGVLNPEKIRRQQLVHFWQLFEKYKGGRFLDTVYNLEIG